MMILADMFIEISSLTDAHTRIAYITTPVRLVNAPGTIYTLGIRGVHQLFSILKQEFINIKSTMLLIEDSTPAFFTALALGYQEMVYTGTSAVIFAIAKKYNVQLFSSLDGLE